VSLHWFEWGAPGPEPSIVLIHATGFHARCWDKVVKALPGRHVLALDLRGHGRSGKTPPFSWDSYGNDLVAWAEHLGLAGAIAAGHSMGGYALTDAAASKPEAFSRLLLIDPVILPPELYAERASGPQDPSAHPTAKRRNHWENWEAMEARFADRLPFKRWEPAVLQDYCRYGVLPGPEGDFVLACPPEVEASIYLGSAGRDIYQRIPEVRVPVTVLRAPPRTGPRDVMDFSASPTWPELASKFPQARDVVLPEHSHFIPMEAPALTAAYILGER
jgi:pimeloyl-ACP methyl ester carboxylesterase